LDHAHLFVDGAVTALCTVEAAVLEIGLESDKSPGTISVIAPAIGDGLVPPIVRDRSVPVRRVRTTTSTKRGSRTIAAAASATMRFF
jgi:hypothetical protein